MSKKYFIGLVEDKELCKVAVMSNTELSGVVEPVVVRGSIRDDSVLDVARDIVSFMKEHPEVGGQNMTFLFSLPNYCANQLLVQVQEPITELRDKEFQHLIVYISYGLYKVVQQFVEAAYKRLDTYVARCKQIDAIEKMICNIARDKGLKGWFLRDELQSLAVAEDISSVLVDNELAYK